MKIPQTSKKTTQKKQTDDSSLFRTFHHWLQPTPVAINHIFSFEAGYVFGQGITPKIPGGGFAAAFATNDIFRGVFC